MYPHNLTMSVLVSESRRADMLRQAELARRAQFCAPPHRQSRAIVAAVRQRVGLALVQVGQRVHGAPAGADAVAALPGALRTAR